MDLIFMNNNMRNRNTLCTLGSQYGRLLLLIMCIAQTGYAEQLKFEGLIIPNQTSIPNEKNAEVVSILIVLKITNISSEMVLINKYANPIPYLMEQDSDKQLTTISGNYDVRIYPQERDFVYLKSKESTYLTMDCDLKWINGELWLIGRTFNSWYVKNIKPGKYQCSLHYSVKTQSLPSNLVKYFTSQPWAGNIKTSPVSFIISN